MTHADGCGQKEFLVAYLYGECGEAERRAFEAHLAVCSDCAHELEALRGVRVVLDAWVPPEPAPGFRIVRRETEQMPLWRRVRMRPAWAAAAAVILVVAAAAAIANLELRYEPEGFVVRTGWTQRRSAPARPPATVDSITKEAWRADLAALERQLRTEFDNRLAQGSRPESTPGSVEAELLRQVRALIETSERRQQRELALRLAQVTRELDAQRAADLLRIQQGFGQVVGLTGAEVARQRELMNYLIRVSQRQ